MLTALWVAPSLPQTSSPSPQHTAPDHTAAAQKLTITVTDENLVAVGSARVQLQPPPPALALRCGTDFAGHCEFTNLPSGTYELRVEKPGFYAAVQAGVQVGITANVDVTLTHQQEAREVVDVVESAPGIDMAQVSTKEELTGTEIVDIPYPATHDYRNSLTFIPGVTPDAFGQPHVAGAETYQTLVLLDGFNVTQPTNGQLAVRTSVDSFRSIDVTPAREPAEFGKGSGGVLGLNTRMGDDHFRMTSTDFLPGVQTIKGISIGQWTPIYTISGPIRKGRMWFIDALDGEYDNNIITQLPSGSDNDHTWRVDNLAKLQSNLTTRNFVTVSFLSNYYHNQYAGLSLLQPQPTTPTDAETAYIGSLKDQYYFRGGALLETGFGVDQYSVALTPQGNSSFIQLAPSSANSQLFAGNYYLHENNLARRVQGLANLYLPPHQWHGRHDLKFGTDVDRLNYNAQFLRQPISFLQPGQPSAAQPPQPCPTDSNGVPVVPSTCTRYSAFSAGSYSTLYNAEASAYAEDRWLITNRLLIEPGLRFDWDEIIRTSLFSPRLAGTYILDDEGNAKVSAGIGITYDNTTLGLIHQPLEGQRTDYFFDPNGCPQDTNGNAVTCINLPPGTPEPAAIPVPTTFTANRNTLSAPRYLNWSIGLEKKLPYAIFLKLEFLEKRGTHGFAYNTLNGVVDGNFLLGNGRDDRYDAFTVSARRRFRQHYEIFGAYTRSRAHTNQVFDFSLDIPLLSPQLPGPYPWDTPNRFVGWGILPFFNLPLIHKLDMVYSAEARTGLPFLATTDQGQISPGTTPETYRLPTYYTFNLQFEKRFHLFGRYWAIRAGFNNVTNHGNAQLANGIIDPTHLSPTFIDANGRAFTGRLRYLGRQ
ncbi:MAG TPA: carboxypeptidase regulatory-like domain-containing protein [Candidatus Dormibacteraeota bacterium]|nr:carboxypeptidase regulatory-like domain-containing protein [Candidatus Dormibacteraeota bacterium]